MVRRVRDGRFGERPHYKPEELDDECESVIVGFLRKTHGEASFPVDTEDLKNLIERDAHELDCYADLSAYGANVEGLTEFRPGKKPIVRIAKALTEDERYENRLRTTLTHEYGHVHFHSYLFGMGEGQTALLQNQQPQRLISKRDDGFDAPESDWMEWQARYACGALLMPKSFILKIVNDFLTEKNHFGLIAEASDKGRELIARVVAAFKVSQDAARVRLIKLNALGQERGPSLFG